MSFLVLRCVCCEVSFQELRDAASKNGVQTIEELHEVAIFGTGCGLCLPYVALMLRTGRVEFKVEEVKSEE